VLQTAAKHKRISLLSLLQARPCVCKLTLYTHARFTAVFFDVDFDFKPLSELESESEISPPALRFKPQDAMTEENESETSLRMRVLTFPSSSRRNKLSSRLFTVLKENRISFFFYLQ
jgi:hypothetical protein